MEKINIRDIDLIVRLVKDDPELGPIESSKLYRSYIIETVRRDRLAAEMFYRQEQHRNRSSGSDTLELGGQSEQKRR